MGLEAARGTQTLEGGSLWDCSCSVSDGHRFSSSLSIRAKVPALLAHPGSEVGVSERLWWSLEVFPQCGPSASPRGPSRPLRRLCLMLQHRCLTTRNNSHLLKIAGSDLAVPQLGLVENTGGFLESESQVQKSQAHSSS